ncbi:MAG TPA: DUF481 domain-containing protein [Candidatus Polarisedimenticolaceae bacterium]|nr:DUF481 domain-containing protein [Candidatus Polarisedimenticolaceae bacterium]
MKQLVRAALLVGLGLQAASALAQTEPAAPARPWTDAAELAFVSTTGNSETTNLAFGNKFVYKWTKAEVTVDAAALRTETTTRVLTNPAGAVVVDETSAVTAEAYSLAGKYRRQIQERLFWYVLAGWNRNRFAGIDDRTTAGGGIGYRILNGERHMLAAELGVDYTDESQVSGTSDSYGGARAFLGYQWQLNANAKFNEDLEVLENLDETSDLRAKSVTSITASISKKIALKGSFTVLFDNEPVEIVVPGDTVGVPDAVFQFDETDTILAASLVVNF